MSAPIGRRVVGMFQRESKLGGDEGHLTEREQEVLTLLNRGFQHKEIAPRLGMAEGTLRTHIARIYQKLQVRSRAEAMLRTGPRRALE